MAQSELLNLMQNLLNGTLWPVLNKRESRVLMIPVAVKFMSILNLWDWSLLLRSQSLAGCLAVVEGRIT